MALSYDLKMGDGSTEVFPFNFAGLGKGYLVPSNLRVELRNVTEDKWYRTDSWTLETTNSLRIVPAPEHPSDSRFNVRIRRVMPKETPYTDWKVGQNYSDYMINNSFLTQLYICHEVLDGFFETEGGSVDFTASAILFDPVGTDYLPTSTNVDAVLREIDSTFLRKGVEPIDPDPDPDNPDVVLIPDSAWLVDTGIKPRERPLPSVDTDTPVNSRILIRDDTGNAKENNITIRHVDNKIMGKTEDLLINEDWAWVELIYLGKGDWRVTSGGVGSQIEPSRLVIIEAAYPVNTTFITTTNINPNILLGVGVWTRIAQGRALVGEGATQDEAGNTFSIASRETKGKIGQVLAEKHIPKHRFAYNPGNDGDKSSGTGGSKAMPAGLRTRYTEYYGASNPEMVGAVQPSFGIYVWERVG